MLELRSDRKSQVTVSVQLTENLVEMLLWAHNELSERYLSGIDEEAHDAHRKSIENKVVYTAHQDVILIEKAEEAVETIRWLNRIWYKINT